MSKHVSVAGILSGYFECLHGQTVFALCRHLLRWQTRRGRMSTCTGTCATMYERSGWSPTPR